MTVFTKKTAIALSIIAATYSHQVITQESEQRDRIYEEVLVIGSVEDIRRISGSANLLDEENIARFDTVNINQLLRQVPGVYLRQEDGYGLRPNIGLRGATSERSQKITLMEDGVLTAPAPYSAPAAYYLPNIGRIETMEVFKGPSAIAYGPHTVGGALNLVTAPVPNFASGKLEASYGTDNYRKLRGSYGDSVGDWSYLVDGLHFGADGFKELDDGGDTGFTRNDINAKLQWNSDSTSALDQSIQLKLGYADEDSNETYLGLSDADFAHNPDRRYLTSTLDRFESEHWQAHLTHVLDVGDNWQLTSKLYYNSFDRRWFKFDGFIDDTNNVATPMLLANPQFYLRQISLLRGEINSTNTARDLIDITDFDRQYGSSGVDITVNHQRSTGEVDHEFEFGLRLHTDYVERRQQPFGYRVENADLVFDGVERGLTVHNKWKTDAIAVFVSDSMTLGDWTVDLGLRYESIEGVAHDRLTKQQHDSEQSVLLPGLGLSYDMSETITLLAGVNKGFSPASPGASDSVKPEESINYEYGIRYRSNSAQADLIGFFSHYDNLLGRCRVSDPGCTPGEEFNGGDVEVSGAELSASYAIALSSTLQLPASLTYTYTESAFQSSFYSGFSQWNPGYFEGLPRSVRKGDELPYMPTHQGRVQIGLSDMRWRIDLALNYVGKARELPGYGAYEAGKYTKALTTLGLAASYEWSEALSVKLVAENLSNEREITSRRPFGARPNAPRSIRLGLVYQW